MPLTWQQELGEILGKGYDRIELHKQLFDLIDNEKQLSFQEGVHEGQESCYAD